MAARRIGVGMQKGGVGKSTVTCQLAWGLALKKRRVLVVDLDFQGNSTATLTNQREGFPYTTYELLFAPEVAPVVQPAQLAENLDVVPATQKFWRAEREIQVRPQYESPYLLQNALKRFSETYDYVLCDLNPNIGGVFGNAVLACPELICPAEAQRLSLSGVPDLLDEVAKIAASPAAGPRRVHFVANKCIAAETETQDALVMLEALVALKYPKIETRLFQTRLPGLAAIRKAMGSGRPIYESQYRGKAQDAFVALVDELLALEDAAVAAVA